LERDRVINSDTISSNDVEQGKTEQEPEVVEKKDGVVVDQVEKL
jgi:hypothetical protein